MEKIKNSTQPVVPKRLFGWQDGKFEPDDLERLEKAWERWKGKNFATEWDEDDDEEFVRTQTLKGGDVTSHRHVTSFFYLIKSWIDSGYVSILRDASWMTHGS